MPKTLTQNDLKLLLDYDAKSGRFTWLKRLNNNSPNWPNAGSLGANGYVYISIGGHRYLAHRLAWLYVHGCWPDGELDHKNGDRADNTIINLRPATSLQNKGNAKLRADNKTGFKGVRFLKNAWNPEKPYAAYISVNSKHKHLGCYATAEEASARYQEAAKEHFGEFAR